MEPITMMAIGSLIAGAAAGGGGVLGSIMGGNAERDAVEYNAKIAEHKAAVAREQAKVAEYMGAIAKQSADVQGEKIARQRDDVIAAQKVAASKSGVISTAPLHVMADTATRAEHDIRLAKWAGEVEYLSKRYEGKQLQNQADVYLTEAAYQRRTGKSAQSAATVGAISIGFGTASSLLGSSVSMFGKGKKK